jgi:hypothetical protein
MRPSPGTEWPGGGTKLPGSGGGSRSPACGLSPSQPVGHRRTAGISPGPLDRQLCGADGHGCMECPRFLYCRLHRSSRPSGRATGSETTSSTRLIGSPVPSCAVDCSVPLSCPMTWLGQNTWHAMVKLRWHPQLCSLFHNGNSKLVHHILQIKVYRSFDEM